jgi:hypothetical protein
MQLGQQSKIGILLVFQLFFFFFFVIYFSFSCLPSGSKGILTFENDAAGQAAAEAALSSSSKQASTSSQPDPSNDVEKQVWVAPPAILLIPDVAQLGNTFLSHSCLFC